MCLSFVVFHFSGRALLPKEDLVVVTETTNITDTTVGQRRSIGAMIIHKDFSSTSSNRANDIAILLVSI
jgi:hypothetical protein